MNILTILTQSHIQDLEELFLDSCAAAGGLYTIQCPKDSLDIDALAALLERIIIIEHPVYGYSAKLTNMAFRLRNAEIHQANVAELARYIEEHDVLHLEGYTAFRMSDYLYKLDIMMYCLIKKMKLTDSLPL